MISRIERLALRHALIQQIGTYIKDTFADENNQLINPATSPGTILLGITVFADQLRSYRRNICRKTEVSEKTYLEEVDKAEQYAVEKLITSF